MRANVLIACEESGRVRDAFLRLGANAISCDLLPTSSPGPHVQGDVRSVLADPGRYFGGPIHGMVAHPPCTYLCSTQNRWITNVPANPKPGVLYGEERRQAQLDAVDFVRELLEAPIPCIAVENPVGVLTSHIRKADQYVQPWQYGEPFIKATGLWLVGLPKLTPTNVLPAIGPAGEDNRQALSWKMPPSPGRSTLRSKTYPGIAAAIAQQWLPSMQLAAEAAA